MTPRHPYEDPLPIPTNRGVVDALIEDVKRKIEIDPPFKSAFEMKLFRFGKEVVRVRAEQDARDLAGLDGLALAEEQLRAENTVLRLLPAAGGETRLLFWLFCWGIEQGRGFEPALDAVRRLHVRARLQAEVERRGEVHRESLAAATVWGAMLNDEDGPHVVEALGTLTRRIGLTGLVRRYSTGPVPLLEARGQVPLTLQHEMRGEDVLAMFGEALGGAFGHIPLAVARDLQNEARRLYRSERRGLGDHAKAPVFEVEIEVVMEAPAEDGPLRRILRDEAARRDVGRLRAKDPEVARTMELLAHDMTQEEAAQILGVTPRTVRQRRDRARKILTRHK
jgi:hypothetical protein